MEERDSNQPEENKSTPDEQHAASEERNLNLDLPGTSNEVAEGSSSGQIRKKRFSSRNYRNPSNSSSSSDDDDDENSTNGNKKTKMETTSGPPPPTPLPNEAEEPTGAEEPEMRNESDVEDDDDEDQVDTEVSSSESSSSESNMFEDSNSDTSEDVADEVVEFLYNTERPKTRWFALHELFAREHGLRGIGNRAVTERDSYNFRHRVCGSLNCVERLELMYKMESHTGCVNSLNFSPDGKLLASGSDDKQIVLWNWASNTVAHKFYSGHHSNIFQTKFYGGTNLPDIRIISSSRDGLVRSHRVPSNGNVVSKTLYKHIGPVNSVAIIRNSPFEIMSAGEDGMVIQADMRVSSISRLVTVKENRRKIVLYGICSNPNNSDEFCVYGQHRATRVYDRRNTSSVCKEYYPQDIPERAIITCATYNKENELLASYSDQDIYLFDRADEVGHFQNRYRGHSNSQTIKGVNFFGPRAEFIVSGSDCGNIFFWEKKSGRIVQFLQGDENGAINVLEGHPEFPFLATSGIDSDVKIWVPSNEKAPDLSQLDRCVRRNMKARQKSLNADIFDADMYDLVLRTRLRRLAEHSSDVVVTTDFQTESDAEENREDNSSSDDESYRRDAFPCSPM